MSRKFTTVSSFADLLGPYEASQDAASKPAQDFHDKRQSLPSRRLAAQTPSYVKQGQYAMNVMAKKLSLEKDFASLTESPLEKVSNGNNDSEIQPKLTHSPWRTFSSSFPALSAAMREEFPFWEPSFSSFLDIYHQLNLFCHYHPIRISEFAYHTWYCEAMKGILSGKSENWKGDEVARIEFLVERNRGT